LCVQSPDEAIFEFVEHSLTGPLNGHYHAAWFQSASASVKRTTRAGQRAPHGASRSDGATGQARRRISPARRIWSRPGWDCCGAVAAGTIPADRAPSDRGHDRLPEGLLRGTRAPLSVHGSTLTLRVFSFTIVPDCTPVMPTLLAAVAILAFPTSWRARAWGLGAAVAILWSTTCSASWRWSG